MKRYNHIVFIYVLLAAAHGIIFSQDRQTISGTLEEIIAQEKYTYEVSDGKKRGNKGNPLLKKIRDFINGALKKLSAFLDNLKANSFFLYFVFVGAAIVFTLAILGTGIFLLIKFLRKSYVIKDTAVKPPILKAGHYNYELDLAAAQAYMEQGRFKEAVPKLLNALWLFFHLKKIITYRESKTNREYLKLLEPADRPGINTIVYEAEEAVYLKETVSEAECTEIYTRIKEILQ